MMAAAHGVMWLSTPSALYLGTAVAGAAYGSAFPVLVLLVRELYGEKHFGANYNVYDGGGSCLGTVVFAKYLVQAFYDRQKVPSGDGEFTCHGPKCFPYPVVLALACTALFTALLLNFGPLKPTPFQRRKRTLEAPLNSEARP